MIKKNVLITGGFGFLGRTIALAYKKDGHCVTGVGHGSWSRGEYTQYGFETWLEMDIDTPNLRAINGSFDVIIHCAGSSSVQDAHIDPLFHYNKTVQSSLELLEYIRLYHPAALFIYSSSAAVYGVQDDVPIKETNKLNPISAYGFYKRMVEEACDLYAKNYDMKVAIVRFFSIYGPGLYKQLLWDAAEKLCSTTDKDIFFCGTGEETRDWIHIEDAANLILELSKQNARFILINGASGTRTTVRSIIEMLCYELNLSVNIQFNNIVREGDPKYYLADISRTKRIGWVPNVLLSNGISEYLTWFREHHD